MARRTGRGIEEACSVAPKGMVDLRTGKSRRRGLLPEIFVPKAAGYIKEGAH